MLDLVQNWKVSISSNIFWILKQLSIRQFDLTVAKGTQSNRINLAKFLNFYRPSAFRTLLLDMCVYIFGPNSAKTTIRFSPENLFRKSMHSLSASGAVLEWRQIT